MWDCPPRGYPRNDFLTVHIDIERAFLRRGIEWEAKNTRIVPVLAITAQHIEVADYRLVVTTARK